MPLLRTRVMLVMGVGIVDRQETCSVPAGRRAPRNRRDVCSEGRIGWWRRGIEIARTELVCVVVAMQLCAVMALERLGQFLEKLHELGGRLIGQIDRQTHQRQVVGLERMRTANARRQP